MKMKEDIKKLKNVIDNFNHQPSKNFKLNDTISIEEIRTLEEKYHITLPEDYVVFITEIGDGGIVERDGDIVRIQSLSEYEKSGYSYKRLGESFPLKRSWEIDLGDEIEGDEELDEEFDEEVMEQHYVEQMDMVDNCGNLIILSDNSDEFEEWRLIVKGDCKGEIWLKFEGGIRRGMHCNFIKWLELYLTGEVYNFYIASREREFQTNQDQKEKCITLLKKKKVVMNPTLFRHKIHEFEQRHNIKLPSEYVDFLTEVGDGSKEKIRTGFKINMLSEFDNLKDLDQPFLIQSENDYNRICLDEDNDNRLFVGQYTMWNFLFEQSMLETCSIKEPWLLPEYQLLKGCLPIINGEREDNSLITDHVQYILILNGDYKGQVWEITGKNMFSRTDTIYEIFSYIFRP